MPIRRLIVNLSDRWDHPELADLDKGDVVLYPAGCEPSQSTGASFIKMHLEDSEACTVISQFMDIMESVEESRAYSLLSCFANDYFSYSVRPAAAAISSVVSASIRYPEADIIILATRTHSDVIPLLGFQTLESGRGSAALLHARYAKAVLAACPPERTRFIELRGDWMHVEFLRQTVLNCAGRLLTFLWIVRTLSLSFFVWLVRSRIRGRLQKLAVVRVEHQARFAAGKFRKPF